LFFAVSKLLRFPLLFSFVLLSLERERERKKETRIGLKSQTYNSIVSQKAGGGCVFQKENPTSSSSCLAQKGERKGGGHTDVNPVCVIGGEKKKARGGKLPKDEHKPPSENFPAKNGEKNWPRMQGSSQK
jgi:hypothetical protein